MKKIILGVVVAVLATVGFAVWWGVSHMPKASAGRAPKIVTVDRGPIRQVVMASGTIAANYEVDIKCKASGEVITLPFDVSDRVKKGELVLELDPIDEQRQVDQQTAALEAAQCRLNDAQQAVKISEQTLITDTRAAEVALQSAKVDAAELRSKANRSKLLLDGKLLSMEEWEAADAAAARADASVETAKNALEALKVRPIAIERDRTAVKLAEIAVKTARTDLADAEQRFKDTHVFAPIDGVVTTRPVQVGTIVSSGITNVGGGSSIMMLSDLSRLFVLAPVDEADIGRVKAAQKVVIRCDAFAEKKFEGTILRIAAKGVTQQAVVTFQVKIEILGEGKELLKPEMTADIEIVVAERDKALRVPSEAVLTRSKDQSRYVLVPREGAGAAATSTATAPSTSAAATAASAVTAASASAPAATTAATTTATAATAAATNPAAGGEATQGIATVERTVQVGADDGSYCEILSGLAEGDKVVIATASAGDWAKLRQNMGEEP